MRTLSKQGTHSTAHSLLTPASCPPYLLIHNGCAVALELLQLSRQRCHFILEPCAFQLQLGLVGLGLLQLLPQMADVVVLQAQVSLGTRLHCELRRTLTSS